MANISLKLKRIEKGMTQSDVAVKLGISTPAYSMIESGKRKGSLDFWENVQKLYNIEDFDMWKIIMNRR